MSSGGYVPYHLRYNKAVERQAFIGLLQRLSSYIAIHNYQYISFGGPFLEDFKIMHTYFGMHDMICIEGDANVHRRQMFNKPLDCIKCVNTVSNEFIDTHNFGEQKTILWLDYTTPSQLREQIVDYVKVLEKLDAGDVFKITLNADPETICKNDQAGEKLYTKRLDAFKSKVHPYFPIDKINSSLFCTKNYPIALLKVLEYAAKKTLNKTGYVFFPLSSFVYSDTNQMITLTGIMLKEDEIGNFLTTTQIKDFFFFLGGWERESEWNPPIHINLPYLSVKEKIWIDEKLPSTQDVGQLCSIFDFLFKEEEQKSIQSIENYLKFYRQYPQFSRVIL